VNGSVETPSLQTKRIRLLLEDLLNLFGNQTNFRMDRKRFDEVRKA